MSNNHSRIFGLDLIRAIAIIVVVICHANRLLNPLIHMPNIIGKIIGKLVAVTNPLGFVGVEIFFVLSGFLIGGILIRTIMNQDNFGIADLKTFWFKRWFRTLPIYYLILFVSSVLYYYLYNTAFDWRYIFFIQNLTTPQPAFMGETWSLAIEEWFYLTLPVVLIIMSFFLKKRMMDKQKIILYAILFFLIAFQLIRIINAINPSFSDPDAYLRKIVCFRLDAIMYGVLIAYLMQFKNTFLVLYKNKLLVIGLTGVVLVVSLAYISNHPKIDYYHKYDSVKFIYNAFLFTLLPLLFSLILPYFYFIKSSPHEFIGKCITQISLVSYSMYLIHYTLIFIPFFSNFPNETILSSIALYVSYWIIILIISNILYYSVEVQFLKLRDRVVR